MALDLDHPIHQMMLRWSQRAGKPWPPDPYLGALSRAAVLLDVARDINADLDDKLTELEAARAEVDRLVSECTKLDDDSTFALVAALYMGLEAGREKISSPWAAVLDPPDDDAPHAFPRKTKR